MKANNGKGNNPSKDEWETPQELFDVLNKEYGFEVDCCATDKNKKCDLFSSKFESVDINPVEIDFLTKTAWMNPPFSKAWKMFEQFFKIVKKGVAIYRIDNLETGIWQKIILPNASWIFVPNRRVNYEGLDGEGARFPSALIGYHVKEIKTLGGITLKPLTGEHNCD